MLIPCICGEKIYPIPHTIIKFMPRCLCIYSKSSHNLIYFSSASSSTDECFLVVMLSVITMIRYLPILTVP